jgi:hypothetical protein
VDAAERPAHLGAESVGDVVSRNPAAGAVAECCGHVGGVWFRTDDHDPLSREAVRLAAATMGKSGAIDDHEIWFQVVHRCGKFSVEEVGLPASVLPFE